MFGRDKNKQGQPGPPRPGPAPKTEGECSGGGCDCGDPGGSGEAATPADAAAMQIAQLKQQIEELNTKYLRTVADYQNVARRSVKDADEARYQGMKSVVLHVLTVLDHFDLALSQDVRKVSAEQIVGGVRVIRDELMKVLQNHGVEVIAPQPDAEFDPNWHQAVTHQQAEGIEPGHVVATLQTGYKLDDRVIRPAMVSVRPRD
jgi:molecular chaperone GrpE